MEIILFTLVCNVDAVYDRPPGEVMSSPHYGVWKFNTVEERNISSLQPSHRMEEVFLFHEATLRQPTTLDATVAYE